MLGIIIWSTLATSLVRGVKYVWSICHKIYNRRRRWCRVTTKPAKLEVAGLCWQGFELVCVNNMLINIFVSCCKFNLWSIYLRMLDFDNLSYRVSPTTLTDRIKLYCHSSPIRLLVLLLYVVIYIDTMMCNMENNAKFFSLHESYINLLTYVSKDYIWYEINMGI